MIGLKRRYGVSAILVMGLLALSTSNSIASIRMDGSEFQGSSLVATSTSSNKTVIGAKMSTSAPSRIVATFGQPLMGAGTMTPPTSNGVAFKFGIGYEYNVLKTSYDYECACLCATDPACNGIFDIQDIVAIINVAYRGYPSIKSGNCPQADSDVDCSGETSTVDIIKMIDVVFRDAPAETVFCDPCK